MTGQDLAALQRWFAQVMTHPGNVRDGIAAAETSQLTAANATVPSGTLSVEQRLGIYHSAYRSRLIDCLADDYPALQHALGPARFRALCLEYIARFPSRSPSLNSFGAHMPAYCAQADLPDAACCAELATLEWAIVEVIHAAEGNALAPEALAELTPEQFGTAHFEPSPALRLLWQHFPVNAYYSAFRHGAASALPPAAESCTLVRRRASQVTRESLENDLPRAKLLAALLACQPMAAALGSAAESGMGPDDVRAAFEHFLTSGYFVGLSVGS